MQVSGGVLIGSVDSVNHYDALESRFTLPDNFEITVDYNIVSGADSAINGWNVGMKVLTLYGNNNGIDIYNRGYITTYTEDVISGGVVINTTNVASTDTSGSLRIIREEFSKYYQTFYWNGLSWTAMAGRSDLFETGFIEAQVTLYIENYNSNPGATVHFDNFSVVSGGFICPGSSSSSSVSSSSSTSSSSSSISSSSSSVSSSSSSESSSSESSSSSSSSSSESLSFSSSSSSVSSSSSSSISTVGEERITNDGELRIINTGVGPENRRIIN
jgi:hypothetical protein